MRAGLALAVFLLSIGLAQAAAGSIADCERIREADAYNQCLAAFGPAARSGGASQPVPAGADAPAMSRGRGHAKPAWLAARQAEGRRRIEERRRRSGVTVERRGGRVRATIDLRK